MLNKVAHIGIAVESIEKALGFWRDGLGLELVGSEEVTTQKVRVAFLPLGEFRIELLEGTSEDSPIAKFVAKRGEGINHVCFEVDDIEATLADLKEKGFRLIHETPVPGAHDTRVAFLHPKSASGVLLELVEKK